jgi:hypothetical protein
MAGTPCVRRVRVLPSSIKPAAIILRSFQRRRFAARLEFGSAVVTEEEL